ncbi:MAG TPA: hypothetical protein VFA28_18425 [Bryobacteraceae bacterium]|jgi:hypothetical protein|nr:hypothetical protein [Bryobacteraceae bacterium]
MAKTSYFVSVAPDAEFASVANALRSAGANVKQDLNAIGLIEIEADEDSANRLRSLPGVAAVEPASPGVQLPPPDSPVQ